VTRFIASIKHTPLSLSLSLFSFFLFSTPILRLKEGGVLCCNGKEINIEKGYKGEI
jgi:hypothetical protein